MLDRARVLFISDAYPPLSGDLSLGVRRCAQLLKSRVQSLEVLTFSADLATGTVTTDIEEGVSIYRLGIPKKTQSAIETIGDFITLIHRKNNYQIFHLFKIFYAGYTGIFQGGYHSVKTVLSLRGEELENTFYDPTLFPLFHWVLNQASSITATSQDLVQRVKALRGASQNLFWTPESIDEKVYCKKKVIDYLFLRGSRIVAQNGEIRMVSSDNSSVPVQLIGYMGELRIRYGFKILLHAFQLVAKKIPQAYLVLVGDMGEEEERLFLQFLSTSGLKDRIFHLPFVEENQIPQYLSSFDVFALPALRGDIPLLALKSMACENTLVCSEIGGFQDLIQNGINGYLVPPGNPRALSNRLLKILEKGDPEVGKKAKETIWKHYLSEKEQEGYVKVYQSLLL